MPVTSSPSQPIDVSGCEPRDPDLTELADVAGKRGRITALGPQLGRGFDECPAGMMLCRHGSWVRPSAGDSSPAMWGLQVPVRRARRGGEQLLGSREPEAYRRGQRSGFWCSQCDRVVPARDRPLGSAAPARVTNVRVLETLREDS